MNTTYNAPNLNNVTITQSMLTEIEKDISGSGIVHIDENGNHVDCKDPGICFGVIVHEADDDNPMSLSFTGEVYLDGSFLRDENGDQVLHIA